MGGRDGGAQSRHHRGADCRATQGRPARWNIVDDDKNSSDGDGKCLLDSSLLCRMTLVILILQKTVAKGRWSNKCQR